MLSAFWVFIGGGLGSLCRYGISIWWKSIGEGNFPWATLIANAISCIILGALIAWQLKQPLPTSYRLLLMTGFCGGFSTFSTFSSETFSLLQQGDQLQALAYVGLSLLIGLVGIWIGLKLVN